MRLLLGLCVLATWPALAMAQPVFDNPVANAAHYLAGRGAPQPASLRFRYRETRTEQPGASRTADLTIEVAPDWALVHHDQVVQLYDFRLNRHFSMKGETFTTGNGAAEVVFRVMERQNRSLVQQIVNAARSDLTACEIDNEFGLRLQPGPAPPTFHNRGERTVVRCGDREVAAYELSSGPQPLAAFWPVMFSRMTSNPETHQRIRATGRAPAVLEVSFGLERRAAWTLLDVERVSIAYPLQASMQNTTADRFDELLGAGGAKVVRDAVAGPAPTVQAWDRHVQTIVQNEGVAAAAMLLLPSENMFPGLLSQCSRGGAHALCPVLGALRSMPDPAPMALFEIATAEQAGNKNAAIAAMKRAQASPLRDHPALGASFALALLKFGKADRERAAAEGLPTDERALQAKAAMALPYNAAYWTDIGDRYGMAYDWWTATLFYDLASAVQTTEIGPMQEKRRVITQIQNDFPDARLPQ